MDGAKGVFFLKCAWYIILFTSSAVHEIWPRKTWVWLKNYNAVGQCFLGFPVSY